MKRLNKAIALLLVFLLAFSSFGITALAEGTEPETMQANETPVSEDDDTAAPILERFRDLVDKIKQFIQAIKDFVYGILGIVKPVYVPVEGITIDDTLLYLNVGDTLTIIPTISPENASKKKVVWTSANEAVATVNENGIVSGVSGGYAVITATVVDGGMTASVQVFVGDITVPAGGSIQAAIDAAAPGQVIAVAPGLYEEQLTVNKPLTLLGPKAEYLHNDEAVITYPENADVLFGSLLSVSADNVSIKGFSFVNGQDTVDVGTSELVFAGDNISFINNRVVSMGNKVALYFAESNHAHRDRAGVVIRGNVIESNSSHAALYVQNIGAFITENSIIGGSVALQIIPNANTVGGSVVNNIMAAVDAAVLHSGAQKGSAAWTYEGNILTSKAPNRAYRWSDESWRGFAVQDFGVSGIGADPTVIFNGNTIEMPEEFNETLWAEVIGFHFMADVSDTAVFEIADNEVKDVTIGAVMESGQADLSLILADNTFPEGSLVIGNEIKVPVWTDYADTSWYNATDSVFTITTAEQLSGLAVLVNGGTDFSGKTVNLGADIDLNGIEWVPVGNAVNAFSGVFDGNNYTISGLEITDTTLANVGLFGFVRGSVQIKNLTVSETIEIADSKFADLHVGGIVGAGEFSGAVGQAGFVNVTVQGTLTVDVDAADANVYAGGIIGQAKPFAEAPYMLGFAITDSTVDLELYVNLDGDSNVYVGGLAGAIYNDASVKTKVELKDSAVNGEINITGTVADSDKQAYAGGLFGFGVKMNTAAAQNAQFVLTNCTAVTPKVALDTETVRYSETWGRNDWVQASIGDTYYALWTDAAAALQNGQTVTFYGDELIIDKKVTFKKNDITIQGLTDADGKPIPHLRALAIPSSSSESRATM